MQPAQTPPISVSWVYTSSDSDKFDVTFDEHHPHFIPQLRALVNNITPDEEQICMMIKLNMNNREMAQMLNTDIKSVYTVRRRLKRKLRMDDYKTMVEWIKNIPFPELRV